jgi:hypothetical protein
MTELHTPAEVSLGQVLDLIPEDHPIFVRLERADEDFGRPLGDGLRLQRWATALVVLHFAERSPRDRAELAHAYSNTVWAVYSAWRWPCEKRVSFAEAAQ